MPGSRGTDEERFWRKVIRGSGDECWGWSGGTTNDGYGYLTLGREHSHRKMVAHRFSYELANGPIPDGLLVLHSCDNPPCCNPDHLRLGTQSDNMFEMASKGRSWQQLKTHCKHGHEFNEKNTHYVAKRSGSGRYCRSCNLAAVKRLQLRKKGMQQ